jgi:TPR repeat protein
MTTKFDIIKLKSQVAIGNVEAMYTLATNYLYGIGVDVDLIQAHSYLERAVGKGFKPAEEMLETVFADKGKSTELTPEFKGDMFEFFKTMCQDADKGDPGALHLKSMTRLSDDIDDFRFKRAIKDQELACKQEYAPALFSLGIVYRRGNRIKGKQEEGLSMIMRAAEKEYIPALRYMMGEWPEKVYQTIKSMAEKEDADGEVYYMLSQYYAQGRVVDKNAQEAIKLLEKAAAKKVPDACYDLGITYEFGRLGVNKDINKAVDYFEQGVALDDADCMVNLGCILETSDDYPNDKKRAFDLYYKAAEKGKSYAYNNLGTCYKRGIGTEVDKDKALESYTQAADMGCMEAYWNLYMYYMDEVCVQRDFKTAVDWLKKGDEAGNLQCTYQITKHIENGDGIERNAARYFFYLNKAATGGFSEAYLHLANCYRAGIGIHENGQMAFEWYEKAAEVSVEGITALAQCYTYAIGTKQDYDKAVELYKKAAELGDAQAQCDLGICYRSGEGVEKDPKKAIEWYLKAAEQGHGGALNNLGIMYQHGIGVESDIDKAAMYYLKAAEAGNADGQFCIGLFYANGAGVAQDYGEAVKWYRAAAEQGEPDSMYHLALLYNDGLGVEKNPNLVAFYLYEAADRGFQPAIDAINKNRIPRPNAN